MTAYSFGGGDEVRLDGESGFVLGGEHGATMGGEEGGTLGTPTMVTLPIRVMLLWELIIRAPRLAHALGRHLIRWVTELDVWLC